MYVIAGGAGPQAAIQMNGRIRSVTVDPTILVMVGDKYGLKPPSSSNVTTERLIEYAVKISKLFKG